MADNSTPGDVNGDLDLGKANDLTDKMSTMFDQAAAKQFQITKAQTEGNLAIAAAKAKPNV